jgi:hemoglobin
MAQAVSTSIVRRRVIAAVTLIATLLGVLGTSTAYAQAKATTPDKSLCERLGGVFASPRWSITSWPHGI